MGLRTEIRKPSKVLDKSKLKSTTLPSARIPQESKCLQLFKDNLQNHLKGTVILAHMVICQPPHRCTQDRRKVTTRDRHKDTTRDHRKDTIQAHLKAIRMLTLQANLMGTTLLPHHRGIHKDPHR